MFDQLLVNLDIINANKTETFPHEIISVLLVPGKGSVITLVSQCITPFLWILAVIDSFEPSSFPVVPLNGSVDFIPFLGFGLNVQIGKPKP